LIILAETLLLPVCTLFMYILVTANDVVLQVFDFESSKEEVQELDALDKRSAGRRFRMDQDKG